MRRPSTILIVFALLLVSCGSGPAPVTGTPRPASSPSAVPATPSVARTVITHVPVRDIGNIAVRIAIPKAPRYSPGAGVAVIVSPMTTGPSGFQSDPDLTVLGLVSVSYLWPGGVDRGTGARSDGAFDFGGPESIAALRDVVRFASGVVPDVDGRFITDLANSSTLTVLTEEVGLYAFADAGIAAVTVLTLYGDQMQNVQYLVGRENPTGDVTATLEISYRAADGQPVLNPTYRYPQSYGPFGIKLDYTALRWDLNQMDDLAGAPGQPYLDLDGNGAFNEGDFDFSNHVPVMSGKRYFSVALTQTLLDSGLLSASAWPGELATPQEASEFWAFRQSLARFEEMGGKIPNLKVMLVFAQDDHAEVSPDKPHIHQMFQGLRFAAVRGDLTIGFWVRLNPDRSYVQAFIPGAGLDFPDNPANTQPDDWTRISAYAYPGQGDADRLVPLAAVAEMADRAHFGDWDLNLGQVFPLLPSP